MLQEVDISGLDYPALSGLRERIDARVREMRETGGPRKSVRPKRLTRLKKKA